VKIRTIVLDDDEAPESIDVTMTLAEVVVIARWTGGLSGITSPAPKITSEIYDALVGGFVNRFWPDGMNDLRHIAPAKEATKHE
jgi:hypothetical protein